MMGSTFQKPKPKQVQNEASATPVARKCCRPVLYMPKSKAGISAMTTTIITRFRSMLSRIWLALRVTRSGTNRNVSNASNVECSFSNRPPFSKFGLILSISFLIPFIFDAG